MCSSSSSASPFLSSASRLSFRLGRPLAHPLLVHLADWGRGRMQPKRAAPSVTIWIKALPALGSESLAQTMDRFEVFGRTVSGVLGDPQWDSTQRSLAGVEIWAGKKTVASAAKQRGLKWGTVEINDGPEQDLTTAIGFLYGISLIMAVAEGGLAVLAPVCSSFVFANSSKCQRGPGNNYEGDADYAPVLQGNVMAKVAAFYFALAVARRLFALWEQPLNSCMFKLEACRAALDYAAGSLRQRCCDHCRFSAKPYGRRHKKPFRLISAGPRPEWTESLALKCRCGAKGHVVLMAKSADGKYSGTKCMKGSQTYSMRFGKAIVAAWSKTTDIAGPGPLAPRAPPALEWRSRSGAKRPQPSEAGTSWRNRTTIDNPPPAAAHAGVSWRDRTTPAG